MAVKNPVNVNVIGNDVNLKLYIMRPHSSSAIVRFIHKPFRP